MSILKFPMVNDLQEMVEWFLVVLSKQQLHSYVSVTDVLSGTIGIAQ